MSESAEKMMVELDSDFIPISLMKDILLSMITMRPRRSVFMWGKPGIGKTSIVYQVGKELNYDVYELRLGYHDPVDLRGIPVPIIKMKDGTEVYLQQTTSVNKDDVLCGVTKWFIPDFLSFSDKPTILFLDEMNQADRATQKVAQQLVLDHRLGDYKLPENVVVVAAGNSEEDRAFVQRMASPTLNRFFHYSVAADVDGWIDWAIMNDIHPIIIAFIKFKPDYLMQFDPKSNNKAFPTPRTWEFVSDVLKNRMSIGLFQTIVAAVGKGAAIAFKAFMDLYNDIPDINAIFSDPVNTHIPDNPSVRFSLCILLARKATYKNLAAIKSYTVRMGREYCAYTVRYIQDLNIALRETPEFVAWGVEYSELFVDERSLKKKKK